MPDEVPHFDNEAQVQGKIKVNVALPVKPYKKHSQKKRADIPPLEDVRGLLEYAPVNLWRPILFVAAMCGLRAGEIRALQWSNIDVERGIISVTRSADIYSQVYPPKSEAGTRDIPVPRIVLKELKLWKMASKPNKENLVFPNTVGNLMAPSSIHQNFWKKALRDLGLVTEDGKGKFRFHDLRHVAASLYIKSGAQPKKLSVIMGHSSIKITFDLYGHLWEDLEGDRALAEGVENALFSK
ncbi:MAG: site-specific integrase [Caldithrix sp.]|nr:MAG: site-specific integrase [Caldithrix sp.]